MKLILSILLIIMTLSFQSLNASEKSIPEVPVQFRADILTIDSQRVLALSYDNFKKWHTYWKNPGDAGLETKYSFSLNGQELKLAEYEWPIPNKYIEQGSMLAYGYESQYSFFFKVPQEVNGKLLKINSKWLVCKHVCIPGKAELSAVVEDHHFNQTAQSSFKVSHSELIERFKQLPVKSKIPTGLDFNLTQKTGKQELILYYSFTATTGKLSTNKTTNLLFPFPKSPFDFTREELKRTTTQLYGKFPIAWDGEYSEPPQDFPIDGKFTEPQTLKFLFFNPETGKASIIEKVFTNFQLSNDSAEKFFSSIKTTTDEELTIKSKGEKRSLLTYILFAFLGGLILNIMPCVLPVISLKLFGLIKYQESSRSNILKHNLFYTLGILLTFFVLALVIVILKTSGESVGWGFQLQSPTFVAIMAIVIFIFSLNLFGLFEFRVPGSGLLSNITSKESPMGHIFEGILATVLSTPCSAPFLGTALTFAFTSGVLGIFTIFMFIGLGLAFPFIFTAFFPATIKFLPKPGNWMNTLKKILGVTLLLTMIWLFDVFMALTSNTQVNIELAITMALFLVAITLHQKVFKEKRLKYITYILPIGLTLHLMLTPLASNTNVSTSLIESKKSYGLDWQPWSVEAMKKLKAEGKITFIDFTAKWCFTCKVNEKLVLDTPEFKKLVAEKKVSLLLADWTKRDERIGRWLESQGLVGVPAYFIIQSDGSFISLGETISIKEIQDQLK